MRFSFWPNPGHPWDDLLQRCRHAASTGWEGIWFADHFMPNAEQPADGPMLECWSTLAGLAAAVPGVRLGSLVTGITYRHPAVLANIAATADNIAGGRVVLGVGAGWQQNEHDAYGIELGSVTERLDRFEEACEVLTGLLRSDRTDFDGRFYELGDAPLDPKPVGPLPLLVGGGGEKRTLRIAARFADEWNVWGTPETLAQKGEVLEAHCEDVGRDPARIERSTQALLFMSDDESNLSGLRGRNLGMPSIVGTPEEVSEIVGRYSEVGVDELIVPDWTLGDLRQTTDVLDQFMSEVAPEHR